MSSSKVREFAGSGRSLVGPRSARSYANEAGISRYGIRFDTPAKDTATDVDETDETEEEDEGDDETGESEDTAATDDKKKVRKPPPKPKDQVTEEEDEEDDEIDEDDFEALYKAELRKNQKNRKRAQTAEREVKRLRGKMSPEELKEFRKWKVKRAQDEEERERRAGNFDKVLASREAKHSEQLKREREAREAAEKKLRQREIENLIAMEVPKHTGVAIEEVQPMIEKYLIHDEDGELIVVDKKGEPWYNDDTAHPFEPAEFIEWFISKRPFLATVKPVNGSGGKTGKRGKSGDKDEWTPERVANLSHEEFKKHEKEILAAAEANS